MKLWLEGLWTLLFPPKCVLCGDILQPQETDLCRRCRTGTEIYKNFRKRIPFVAKWRALWYYEGDVRFSLLRFKFRGKRSYAESYGRLLAMRIAEEFPEGYDLITWVPVSKRRKHRRGYDQVELLAAAVAAELGQTAVSTLIKHRDNPPQSGITGMAQRKANVLNVYRIADPQTVKGKRILLLDDILTTGATVSECARVLMTAGAKEVYCAAVAANSHER
ncbi:MAG: ComF family protein [Oscillospiraceae bacterium]|nr:ComF family protein [Oscillospiraceae bacterium]